MPGDIWLTFPDGRGARAEGKRHDRTGRFERSDLHVGHRQPRPRGRSRVTDGRWYVEDRGSFNGTFLNGTRVATGNASPAAARRPDRNRRGDGPLLLAGSAAGPGHDRAARRGRAHGFRAAVLVPAPGRAVPLRAVARGRESRDACRRTSRSPRNSGRPAQPEPSKPHCVASTQRPGSRISPHTRSVAHSVASHASAAGSRKTAREHAAPSRPLRSNCEG